MKITIVSTDQITEIDGVPVRAWLGVTEDGIECDVFVHRVAVRDDRDCGRFEAELKEKLPPGRMVPLRLILN